MWQVTFFCRQLCSPKEKSVLYFLHWFHAIEKEWDKLGVLSLWCHKGHWLLFLVCIYLFLGMRIYFRKKLGKKKIWSVFKKHIQHSWGVKVFPLDELCTPQSHGSRQKLCRVFSPKKICQALIFWTRLQAFRIVSFLFQSWLWMFI